ncbi:hydroxyethylthiazole kinase [Staphylococcus sp. SQ8-PEA]|uniref:Hydroxyethylthiazole kinase n=1 Tax=Staphylococcus marylandisciuri TaxID=2981529 RepID=A0ABT2QRH4_9STAP|nr:hydroxyethylthiazole kinase [Staphylococcus marylandisciuri]MCU5746558.1 hydroxyethylthiazole kinase [Staphylococcus marylandisciuri]
MSNIEDLRKNNPLTVCYTNDVVKNFSANGLLSLGASPAMSEAPQEADEFTKVAGGLLINIGTVTVGRGEDMLQIAQKAQSNECPIVFDPVAVGASKFRKSYCSRFLKVVRPTVIKGNASEILALIDAEATMKGTDSEDNLDVVSIGKRAYEKFNTNIVITGQTDVIVHEGRCYTLNNGSALLAKVTGAGCLLGAVIASFLQRDRYPQVDKLIDAVTAFNIAAEQAETLTNNAGPGSFNINFIDRLSHVSQEDINQCGNISEVS